MEDDKNAPWVQDLRCITLLDTQVPSAEDIFVDAKGEALPPPAKSWTTTVPYVDGSLAHPESDVGMSAITANVQPEECTILDHPNYSISRIMALLVRDDEETTDGWYCPPTMAQDALSPDELDMVCRYMSNRMHLGVACKGPPTKPWWEDPALLSQHFGKNELVASVLDNLEYQDEPTGSNPPTWGNMYRPTQPHHQPQPAADCCHNFQEGVMTRKDDRREAWVRDSGTPESGHTVVSLVVNLPKEAKSLAHHPKYKAKMEEPARTIL